MDYILIQDNYDCAGDHAAGWETSHILALHPQTVDLNLLPKKGQKLIGVAGKMAPQDANADFGLETLEAAAEIAIKEVRHRLENRQAYHGHGNSLLEGLWKQNES
jgi:creatinine amidohydrolase